MMISPFCMSFHTCRLHVYGSNYIVLHYIGMDIHQAFSSQWHKRTLHFEVDPLTYVLLTCTRWKSWRLSYKILLITKIFFPLLLPNIFTLSHKLKNQDTVAISNDVNKYRLDVTKYGSAEANIIVDRFNHLDLIRDC